MLGMFYIFVAGKVHILQIGIQMVIYPVCSERFFRYQFIAT
jgi:hypothetical protein